MFIDSHTTLLDSIINIVEKKPRNWEDFLLKGLNSLKEGTDLLDGLVNNIINEFKLQNDELISQVELQKVKGFLDLVDYSQKK